MKLGKGIRFMDALFVNNDSSKKCWDGAETL